MQSMAQNRGYAKTSREFLRYERQLLIYILLLFKPGHQYEALKEVGVLN